MAGGAGRLDRRITIERYTATQDAFGGDVETWAELAIVSAQYMPVSDAERISANQVNATSMARFVVRSSTVTRSVNPKDRMQFDGRAWDIHGVKETKEGRKRFLEITAASQAD